MGTNYYAKKILCKHCGNYKKYHIGKKSLGWVFLFNGTTYKSGEEWNTAIRNHGNGEMIIEDEYGDEISWEELKEIIVESYNQPQNERRIKENKKPEYSNRDHWADKKGYEFVDNDFS